MTENNENEIVKDKKLKKKSTIKEWIIDIAVVACIALFGVEVCRVWCLDYKWIYDSNVGS